MGNNALGLQELLMKVKKQLKQAFPDTYWVIAEISEISVSRNGHCYLELIEKKEQEEKILAKTRASIWANRFLSLEPYFRTTTGQALEPGMKVMLHVKTEYHEIYGFSLNVIDIEPSFTLGEQEKRRQEIIKRLEDEGVLYMNRETTLPLVPQRIAIISSDTAAGYGDFINQLKNNPYSFVYELILFKAFMQGDQAENSVVEALENIYEIHKEIDLVVIIRGGGSKSELACFDSYWIAYHIAQFPIPVITGIGHERDESIADIVAHSSCKTPTATAEFIINLSLAFDQELNHYASEISGYARELINKHKLMLMERTKNIKLGGVQKLAKHKDYLNKLKHKMAILGTDKFYKAGKELEKLVKNIQNSSNLRIKKEEANIKHLCHKAKSQTEKELLLQNNKIQLLEQKIKFNNPENILKKGYSITRFNGKIIRSAHELEEGNLIETVYMEGKTTSIVKSKRNS